MQFSKFKCCRKTKREQLKECWEGSCDLNRVIGIDLIEVTFKKERAMTELADLDCKTGGCLGRVWLEWGQLRRDQAL